MATPPNTPKRKPARAISSRLTPRPKMKPPVEQTPEVPPAPQAAVPGPPAPVERGWKRLDRAEKVVSIVAGSLAIIAAIYGCILWIANHVDNKPGASGEGTQASTSTTPTDKWHSPVTSPASRQMVTELRAAGGSEWVTNLDLGNKSEFDMRVSYTNLNVSAVKAIAVALAIPAGLTVESRSLIFYSSDHPAGIPLDFIDPSQLNVLPGTYSAGEKAYFQAHLAVIPDLAGAFPCNAPRTSILRTAFNDALSSRTLWGTEASVVFTQECDE